MSIKLRKASYTFRQQKTTKHLLDISKSNNAHSIIANFLENNWDHKKLHSQTCRWIYYNNQYIKQYLIPVQINENHQLYELLDYTSRDTQRNFLAFQNTKQGCHITHFGPLGSISGHHKKSFDQKYRKRQQRRIRQQHALNHKNKKEDMKQVMKEKDINFPPMSVHEKSK